MKHTKIFFALLALTAAVLAFGCKQANSSSFTLNAEQQKAYDAEIQSLEKAVSDMDLPADIIKQGLEQLNQELAKQYKFKIIDKKAGNPVAKGTKVDALKQRFVPAAL